MMMIHRLLKAMGIEQSIGYLPPFVFITTDWLYHHMSHQMMIAKIHPDRCASSCGRICMLTDFCLCGRDMWMELLSLSLLKNHDKWIYLNKWLRTTNPRRRWSLMALRHSSIIRSLAAVELFTKDGTLYRSRWNWGVDWLDIWLAYGHHLWHSLIESRHLCVCLLSIAPISSKQTRCSIAHLVRNKRDIYEVTFEKQLSLLWAYKW